MESNPPEAGDAIETPETAAVESAGTVIDRSGHPISRRSVPENVLKVLYRLHRSGYRAYLCGGSVRDC
jgi:poly(A) polymerase